MSTKFTPGPWLIDDDNGDLSIYVPSEHGCRYVIARDIGGEVRQDASGKYTDNSTIKDNARLIAAAPLLLEACLLARHICEPGNALQQQIDAAIAAATGETA